MCLHRLQAHHRAAWVQAFCVLRSHNQQAVLLRAAALPAGWSQSPTGFRDGCCQCYIPYTAAGAVRPRPPCAPAVPALRALYTLDDIVDIGKIAFTIAIVENLNRLASQQLVRKAKVGHVRAARRTIYGEEAQSV